MQKYRHQQQYKKSASYYRQTKLKKRFKRIILIFLMVLLALASYVILDVIAANKKASTPSQITEKNTVTYNSKFKINQTAFFQFQSNQSWTFMTNESETYKFVYTSFRGNLVERSLTIYVNEDKQLQASRVIPLETNSSSSLLPGFASEHCSALIPENAEKKPQTVIYLDVMFSCDYHSNAYDVVAGVKNGDTNITMKRPDGTNISYNIYYLDSTASPDDSQLREILSTFQPR